MKNSIISKVMLSTLAMVVVFSPISVIAGNGALSGEHYNLNLIGVPKGKTANITSGNRIFVPLYGTTRIMLAQGTSFAVLDGNGTDGSAKFQLPNPDPTNTGVTTYSVYARSLGKPGGSGQIVTCAIDPTTGEEVCSTGYSVSLVRTKGKQTFSNVTKQLLYIYADLNLDGTEERYPIFDSRLQDYFWNYDNNGLKVVQLRFYWTPTNVN